MQKITIGRRGAGTAATTTRRTGPDLNVLADAVDGRLAGAQQRLNDALDTLPTGALDRLHRRATTIATAAQAILTSRPSAPRGGA